MYLKKLPGYRKVPNSRMQLRFAVADVNSVEKKLDDPAFFSEFEKELTKLYPSYSTMPEDGTSMYNGDLGFNYNPRKARPVIVCNQGLLVLEPGQSIPGVLFWHDASKFTAQEGYWVGYIDASDCKSKFWTRARVSRPSWGGLVEFYGMKLMKSLPEENILAACRIVRPDYDVLPEDSDTVSAESSSWQHWNDRDA